MARTYEAIVCGNLKEDSGTVDAPIGRHPTDRKKMCVTQRNSKPAVTHWEVVKALPLHPHPLPPGNGPHPPDPRPYGLHRPTPFWGTRFYGHKKPGGWARTASASTPGLCPFATRETADPSWFLPHCRSIYQGVGGWKKEPLRGSWQGAALTEEGCNGQSGTNFPQRALARNAPPQSARREPAPRREALDCRKTPYGLFRQFLQSAARTPCSPMANNSPDSLWKYFSVRYTP